MNGHRRAGSVVFVADVASDAVQPNHEFSEWRWVDRMDGLEAPRDVGQLLEIALTARKAEQGGFDCQKLRGR